MFVVYVIREFDFNVTYAKESYLLTLTVVNKRFSVNRNNQIYSFNKLGTDFSELFSKSSHDFQTGFVTYKFSEIKL